MDPLGGEPLLLGEALSDRAGHYEVKFGFERLGWAGKARAQHIEPPHAEHQGAFEFGLDLILDSLERLRTTGA